VQVLCVEGMGSVRGVCRVQEFNGSSLLSKEFCMSAPGFSSLDTHTHAHVCTCIHARTHTLFTGIVPRPLLDARREDIPKPTLHVTMFFSILT
jgi:hypothetical protein